MPQILQQVQQTPGAMQAMVAGAMPLPQYTDPASGRTFQMDPQSGQIMELRVPVTVTERLQAQAMMGIGQTVSPAGRKASGQEPPHQEEKSDGRTTVSESKK
jgi:hypothetical protein